MCDQVGKQSRKYNSQGDEILSCSVFREAPVKNAVSSFRVVVHSNDGSGFEEAPGCFNCRFQVSTLKKIVAYVKSPIKDIMTKCYG